LENHKLQLFLDKAVNEELFRKRMEQASSLPAVLGVLKAEGLEMSADEFHSALKLLLYLAQATKDSLADADLDSVSGGVGGNFLTMANQVLMQQHPLLSNKPGLTAAAQMASLVESKFR
jgi:predicted ribosomally synthesized peptide with nif11-like leader